jgi:glycosyltransferase involved in cell wall biosynthesis
MKIGIESQRIFRAAKHGMDVVALELIRKIQQLDRVNEYTLFATNGDDRNCVTDTANFKTKVVGGMNYALWEQFSLPAALKKENCQLLHCTANTAPLKCPVPMIVTVHDVIYLEESNVGGSLYQSVGNMYRRFVVPHVIKNAEKIITVSEYEKSVISDVCKIGSDKIVVVHNGVSERFHPDYSSEQLTAFRRKHTLPAEFILFHGNTAPKKNTTGAIKAYVHYCLNSRNPLPLVVTDFSKQKIEKILQSIGNAGLIRNIHAPGYIPSADMPLLYNCCTLFLYPSLRESFGLPVLEAMACGKPVIAADIPAIREVAGDSAYLVDPLKPELIAEAVMHVSGDDTSRTGMTQRGLERIKQFSWEQSAKKLIELYEQFA